MLILEDVLRVEKMRETYKDSPKYSEPFSDHICGSGCNCHEKYLICEEIVRLQHKLKSLGTLKK